MGRNVCIILPAGSHYDYIKQPINPQEIIMQLTITTPHPSVWLSREAIELSNKLIVRLQIQQGSGLAKMLGVNPIFYNDEAMRIWVQRELNEGLEMNRYTLAKLESRFLDIMSQQGFINHS